MSNDNLRVWPVEGDGYGEMIEYPPFAKYRMEPHYGGATGDANHDLIVFAVSTIDGKREETELGSHPMGECLIAFAGQPSPFKSAGTVAVPKARGKAEKSGTVAPSK